MKTTFTTVLIAFVILIATNANAQQLVMLITM